MVNDDRTAQHYTEITFPCPCSKAHFRRTEPVLYCKLNCYISFTTIS